MSEISDELLRRIAERASDPRRRYMTAAEDESGVSLPVEEIERRLAAFDEHSVKMFREMVARRRAMGFETTSMTFYTEGTGARTSSDPPGAKPLQPPPGEAAWEELERISGWPIPEDLKQIYSVADGGFGPGFTGLNPVALIGSFCEDFRRRGPDYCGTILYPESFLPIANEMLNYHYDVETGRIISSDEDWENHGLEKEDIYDIAFPSLAAMMEDWLMKP